MRVLALDHGTARIGCAISDPSGTLATPLPMIEPPEPRAVAELVAEHGVERVVVGLPLHLSGEEGSQAALARTFCAELEAMLDGPGRDLRRAADDADGGGEPPRRRRRAARLARRRPPARGLPAGQRAERRRASDELRTGRRGDPFADPDDPGGPEREQRRREREEKRRQRARPSRPRRRQPRRRPRRRLAGRARPAPPRTPEEEFWDEDPEPPSGRRRPRRRPPPARRRREPAAARPAPRRARAPASSAAAAPRIRLPGRRARSSALALVLWFLFALFQPFHGDGSGRVVGHDPEGRQRQRSRRHARRRRAARLSSSTLFQIRVTLAGKRSDLYPGHFMLAHGMSYGAAIDALSTAPVKRVATVTIPEGYSRAQAAQLVEEDGPRRAAT